MLVGWANGKTDECTAKKLQVSNARVLVEIDVTNKKRRSNIKDIPWKENNISSRI